MLAIKASPGFHKNFVGNERGVVGKLYQVSKNQNSTNAISLDCLTNILNKILDI